MRNLYEILDVPKDANDLEIVRAYRRLARKYHPDVSSEKDAEEKFKEVKAAYEVLRDPERRAHYDATGGTDTETLDPPRDILMALMKDALVASVALPSINIQATIRLGFDEAQDNINKRIALLRDALKAIKRSRKTLKRKKKNAPNLFHAVVDREITVLTDLVEVRLPELIKNLMEARRMFEDYESDVPGIDEFIALVHQVRMISDDRT